MKKSKKTFLSFLSLIFALSILTVSAFATGTEEKNWYFSNKGSNRRSSLPAVNEDHAIGIGKDEKVIYLTFDAGYENGNVAKIVQTLKENEVSGAFFVLEHFITANPDLTKEIKENGNLVCNHTCRHRNIASSNREELKLDLEKLESICLETCGFEMDKFFRPPEGKYSDAALESVAALGYKTVFWSLAYADWDNENQMNPEKALDILNSKVHNGAVILLHPTSKTNAEILDRFIKVQKEAGYRFASLEELNA